MRDLRTSPLPGDTVSTANGYTYRVLDLFVSVNAAGTENRGVFCSVENDQGDERANCLTLSVYANKTRDGHVIYQADEADCDWTKVTRYPLQDLEKTLRQEHGYD